MTRRLHLASLLAGIVLGACTSAATPAPTPASSASGPATKASPQGAAGQGAASITPQLIARGDSVFHGATCTDCHGRNAKGTPHGPDLTSGTFAQTDGSYDAIVRVITTGVPEDKITDPTFPEPMPARGGVKPPLTDDQIRAVAAYVYSLSHR
jgi:mono/diheme cytochrome c family protein